MFSMCSELTLRARIPDTRIPQVMQPCRQTGFKMLVEYYTWWNMSVRAFYLKTKLIDPDVTPPSTFNKRSLAESP